MRKKRPVDMIEWREASDKEMERLSSVKAKHTFGNFLMVPISAVPLIALVYFMKECFAQPKVLWSSMAIYIVICVGFFFFLVRKIHPTLKYEVSDVIVTDIVFDRATDCSDPVTATVAQGDVVVNCVHISCDMPEKGDHVLLYRANKDDGFMGIIREE